MKLVNRDTAANTIKLNNVGGKNVYLNFNANPGSSVPASLTLAPGQSQSVTVEANWGGAVFAGLQMGNPANNKIEANFQTASGTTFFDVDVEKGFSVPVVCTSGDGLVSSGCSIDKLPSCPPAQRLSDASGATVACSNPQTADSIALMRAGCPNEYVVWDDVQTKGSKSNVISCEIGSPVAAPVAAAPTALAPVAEPTPVTTQAAHLPQVGQDSSTITRTTTQTIFVTAAAPKATLASNVVKAVDTSRKPGAAAVEISSSGAVVVLPALQNLASRNLAQANRLGAARSAGHQGHVSGTLLLVGVLGALVGKKLFN